MDFKVLIIIFCVGFCGLLCHGRNPYDGESLASMYDVGDLKAQENSPRSWDITWKFDDFFSLPQYRQLTGFYASEDMFFHIYVSRKGIYDKEEFSPFWLAYRFKSSDSAEEETWFPNVTCEFYVKTRENKLYKALGDKGRIAKYGGHCNSLIPRSEIIGRNDSLVPEGVLTLVVKLHWWANNDVPFQTADNVESESNEPGSLETQTEIPEIINKEMPERIGILKQAGDSGTSVEVTWKIENFFTLPYRPEVGILSPNFKSDDFHGYFAMDPKGSVSKPESITFRSIVFRGNNRREKIYQQLYLKERDGTLHKFAAREESPNYFVAHVPKSEINVRKEELVPGDVLTLMFKLSTTDDDVNSRGSANELTSRGLSFSTDLPNSSKYPSLASMNNDGVLQTTEAGRSWEIKWQLKKYFILPQYRQMTQSFDSENFWFHLNMTPKRIYDTADITTLQLNWRFKSSSIEKDFLYPEFDVEFYLTTKEGILYSVSEPKCIAAEYGGSCQSVIPRREILDRRDSLDHEGDLTVVGKIRWLKEASTTEDLDSENFIKPEAPEGVQLIIPG